MKKYKVEIEGITPYMQHRMDDQSLEEWEKRRGPIIERPDVSKEDIVRAEFHSYFDNETKKYYVPSEQIRQSLVATGSMYKSKVGNSKKSMKNIVAGMFYVNPEKLYLTNGFKIDKRSAVNQNNKARVISIRPKWENWKVEFELSIDNDSITEETTRSIIESAGQYIGIGSYRPSKGGYFGRFKIATFLEVKK